MLWSPTCTSADGQSMLKKWKGHGRQVGEHRGQVGEHRGRGGSTEGRGGSTEAGGGAQRAGGGARKAGRRLTGCFQSPERVTLKGKSGKNTPKVSSQITSVHRVRATWVNYKMLNNKTWTKPTPTQFVPTELQHTICLLVFRFNYGGFSYWTQASVAVWLEPRHIFHLVSGLWKDPLVHSALRNVPESESEKFLGKESAHQGWGWSRCFP
jgi:hypothetical protein